eukprot:TRINITY_DN39090_c0_g1_i1.p2 TRINITY_DN39090_c0_g1~~TRINITY_DN39090_c0_g1_i1.p2  ORF type:complete len:237 (+),score=76.82 TRINITY_DN39090_c0_g1_i1:76-786(+)
MADAEAAAEAELETINVSGTSCAARVLQLRLYGPAQVHDLVLRKVRALCADEREGIGEEYQLKTKCAEAAMPRWLLCLHAWRAAKGCEGELRRSLVFCDESMRCWLVAEVDSRCDTGAVGRAREDALELSRVLSQLGYPVSDISYLVFTPCCSELQAEDMRARLPREQLEHPGALGPAAAAAVCQLAESDLGRRALEGLPGAERGGRPRLAAGCDPPPGTQNVQGRTVVPRRQPPG